MANARGWEFTPVWQPASRTMPVTATGGIDRDALLREYYSLLPGGTGNASTAPVHGGGHSETMQATAQRVADSQLTANTARRAALEQMLGLTGGGPSSTDWVQEAFKAALASGQSSGSTGTAPTPNGVTTLDGSSSFVTPPSSATPLPTHTNPYEGRLAALLDDPSRIQQSAGYQFRVNQGQEALQRSLGARGMLHSGNRLMALTKYGQDMASQEYDTQLGRLSALLMGRDQTNAQRYGSDRSYAASLYGADQTAASSRYNTDRTFDASRYNTTLSALTSLAKPSMEKAAGNQSYNPQPTAVRGGGSAQVGTQTPLYGQQGFTDQDALRRAYGIPTWTYGG